MAKRKKLQKINTWDANIEGHRMRIIIFYDSEIEAFIPSGIPHVFMEFMEFEVGAKSESELRDILYVEIKKAIARVRTKRLVIMLKMQASCDVAKLVIGSRNPAMMALVTTGRGNSIGFDFFVAELVEELDRKLYKQMHRLYPKGNWVAEHPEWNPTPIDCRFEHKIIPYTDEAYEWIMALQRTFVAMAGEMNKFFGQAEDKMLASMTQGLLLSGGENQK